MKNYFIIPALLWGFSFLAPTQAITPLRSSDAALNDTIELPQSMTSDIDSILGQWHNQKFVMIDADCQSLNDNPTFPDSVYIERLAQLPVVMEMPYNAVVRKFIDLYSGRYRKKVSFMLGAANFYMPIFEEALDAYNLPQELKYLPIIESALDPTATSRVGAVGLWQFMITTGKQYGLESNSLTDDRRDPIKASWAAARYLKDLYAIFGDWNLVIAAYNCGPQNVNKAIHRAGGIKDYWKIYNYLPKETRGYVPAFIAANYVMNYYCEHGICPMEADLSYKSDTIEIDQKVHFRQIEGICKVPVEEIRMLNPQYKNDIVPEHYTLRLPIEAINTFIDQQDSVYAYRADEYLPNRKTVEIDDEVIISRSEPQTTSRTRTTSSRSKRGTTRTHRIGRGETLSTIASRYGVTVNQLKQWNGIRGSNIRAGKSIKIKK